MGHRGAAGTLEPPAPVRCAPVQVQIQALADGAGALSEPELKERAEAAFAKLAAVA